MAVFTGHHANGKPCSCMMLFSEDPEAYVEAHPNKKVSSGGRWPVDLTFNQQIDETKKLRFL